MEGAKANFSLSISEIEEILEANHISQPSAFLFTLRSKIIQLRRYWRILMEEQGKMEDELEQLRMRRRWKLSTTSTNSDNEDDSNQIQISFANRMTLDSNEEREHRFNGSNENLISRRTINHTPEEQQRLTLSMLPPLESHSPNLSKSVSPPALVGRSSIQNDSQPIYPRSSSLSSSTSSPSLVSGYGSATSPTSSSPDIVLSSRTIRQRGHEFKYEFFQDILHSPILDTITIFVLNFIQIETRVLFNTLELCPVISHLELQRVLFLGPFNRHLNLPCLKTFVMSQTTSLRRTCENKNLTQQDFQNRLFFAHWDEQNPIPPTLCRIELVIDGWNQFKIDYESGEFISKLSFANEVLFRLTGASEGRPFQLKRLALQACPFRSTDNSLGTNIYQDLSYLNIQSIVTSSQELIEILRQCINLQELRCKNYIDGAGIHLKDIPAARMKFLCLGLCTYTLAIKYSPGIKFDRLDTLIFPTNICDDETLENIPNIFGSAKKVVAYLCSHGVKRKNSYYILDKILQIQTIEWIWMSNFRRSIIGEDLDSEELLALYEKHEPFLLSSGLREMGTVNFILERKELNARGFYRQYSSSGDVVKGNARFKWVGRVIGKDEHQVLEFQNRDGFKFSTWESYMKRY